MPQWIAVSRTEHADRYYQPRQGYGFASEQAATPILQAELSKLLPHYTLAFVPQGLGYQAVALLSLDGQKNLYVHSDGRWLGTYVPASLRGYPFTLANTEDSKTVLCVDQSQLSSESGGALFNADGELNEPVARTLDFLQQCEKNRQVTAAATQALAEAGVIEAWPLKLNTAEGQEPVPVNGLYRINEQALNNLDDDAYAKLRGGPMALAHAQLFSMSQLNQLTDRVKFHDKHTAGKEDPVDLEDLFGDDDDDLSFNF